MRVAPRGFSAESWEVFKRDGILLCPGVVPPKRVDVLTRAIDEVFGALGVDSAFSGGLGKAASLHPAFLDVIDSDLHVGFAYDLFGNQCALHQSQVFVRPPGPASGNAWHFDGPRCLPWPRDAEFPYMLKIGYWLTPLTEPNAGNLVIVRGSHLWNELPQYGTHERVQGEEPLIVPAGTLMIMHASLWHRVQRNVRGEVRKNLFLGYCPSWICSAEEYDPAEVAELAPTREQRILLRTYEHPYARTKPPPEDYPLFAEGPKPHGRDDHTVMPHLQREITRAQRGFQRETGECHDHRRA